MSELGTVKRAYADGYAAAKHEIERLLALLEIEQKRNNPLISKCDKCGKLILKQEGPP